MKTLTMQELEDLGFEVIKYYTHNHFFTQRRKKGILMVETTWDTKDNYKKVSQDLMVDETYLESFSKIDLLMIDKILNKCTP